MNNKQRITSLRQEEAHLQKEIHLLTKRINDINDEIKRVFKKKKEVARGAPAVSGWLCLGRWPWPSAEGLVWRCGGCAGVEGRRVADNEKCLALLLSLVLHTQPSEMSGVCTSRGTTEHHNHVMAHGLPKGIIIVSMDVSS